MRTRFFVAALLMIVAWTAGTAQQTAAPPPRDASQPAVTFKVEINYVEIDAVVTDSQGHFVRNLTRDDFQVLEDGQPQSLSIFSPVDIPIQRTDPPLFAKAAIPPDVATNRTPFEGRVFVLVVDEQNTNFRRTARTRAAARLFVERFVGANDLVAVVNTGGRATSMQEFTSNRQLVLSAIDRSMGQGADSSTSAALNDYFANRDIRGGGRSDINSQFSDLERSYKARNTLSTLKSLSDYLAGMRGRRKAVIWFSEGINYDITNTIANRYATEIQQGMRDVIAASTRSNVSIYGVDPRGLTSGAEDAIEIPAFADDNSIGPTSLDAELRLQQDSLRSISEETGGFAIINKNDYRDAFGRVLQDSSSYYVLGYYPTNDKRDGRFRTVQVKVLKPGLTVRARKGYVAPRGKAEPARSVGNNSTSPELRDALNSPIPISGLSLAAFAAPFRGPAPNDAIALAIEVDGGTLNFTKTPEGLFASDIELSLFASESNSGKIRDGSRNVLNLKLKPETYEAVKKGMFRVVSRLQLPPGKYQLRVGVREVNGGRLGTVLYDLDAPDFSKQPLVMSGIAITSAAASHVPTASAAQNVNEFKDILPAPPTAARDFSAADTLAIFTEIYDNAGSTPHRVAITASVLSDEGKTVFSTSDERRSEELKGATGGYGYATKIPLNGMAPGRYVLRVEAKSLAGNSTPVTREVEFRVR
jgi:VWFA-related protein